MLETDLRKVFMNICWSWWDCFFSSLVNYIQKWKGELPLVIFQIEHILRCVSIMNLCLEIYKFECMNNIMRLRGNNYSHRK